MRSSVRHLDITDDQLPILFRYGLVRFQVRYCQVIAVLGVVDVDVLPQSGTSLRLNMACNLIRVKMCRNRWSALEPGMGIEPTSAFNYTAGCGKASAARRLDRSAFGDSEESTPASSPA